MLALSPLSINASADTMCANTSSTANSGTLYDSGGPGGNYGNSENCSFLIQPSGGGTITLSFSQFDTQNADQLRIYNGANASAPLLATLNGSSLPSDVVANSGAMYLVFTSNPGGNRAGFTAAWSVASPAATLLAHYKFDVCDWATTGVAGDSVGSYDGAVSGAVSRDSTATSGIKPDTCSSALMAGGAIDINGLPVNTTSGAKTSVSFWMYWSGANSVMPIGWGGHDLWLVSGSFGFNTGNSDVYGIASAGLADGWHHVTAVFTNNNVTANKLYIDGVSQTLTQRQSSPNNSVAVVDPHLRIGGWWRDNGYRFSGNIDEVKVYSGEVTQAQVNADLTYVSATCPTCVPPPPVPAVLVAEYDFDGDWHLSGTLLDAVGAANGTQTGAVTRVDAPASGGKPNTCYAGEFNGGAFDMTGLPVSTASGDTTSVSFWMFWDGTNSVMPMGWQYHDLWLYNGAFGFNSGAGDIYGVSSASLANSWHHVAVVFTNNNMTNNEIYIDGVAQTLSQQHSSPNNSNSVVNSHMRIGGWWGSNGYRFSGRLDELKVYTGSISQAEVLADKDKGCNDPVAWWKMDEPAWTGAGAELLDASGNGHDASAVNGLVNGDLSPAKLGSPGTCRYGDFDGVNDYIAVPGSVPNLTGDFTILSWINARELGKDQRIYADDENNSGGFAFSLGDGGDGRLRFFSRNVSPIIVDTQSAVISANTWHYVAVVHNAAAKTRQIYVDGVAVALSTGGTSSTYTGTWGSDPGSASIGGETNSAGGEAVANWRFNGFIDETRVYQGALSATEIGQLMNETHPCANSPVAEWRFDEGSWSGVANEVVDSSGSNYHGVAVNVSTVGGVLCKAADLSANSASDYLSMNSQAMNGLEDFTLVAWGKSSSINGFQAIVSGASGTSLAAANELVMLFDTANRFTPIISEELFNDTGDISLLSAPNDDAWHQFAWTREASIRESCFYMDGVLQGCVTHPDSNDSDPLSIVAGGLIIGQDQDTLGGDFDASQDWEGLLDEVMVFNQRLSATDIQAGRANILAGNNWDGTLRSCSAVDHYAISYSATPGITCEAQTVRITAHDTNHDPVAPSSSTQITLSTGPAANGWALKAGGGSFSSGPGAGQARYTFDGTETVVELYLTQTTVTTSPHIDIDVDDGTASDIDGSLEDPNIAFVDAAFRFYANGTAETIGTQISGKSSAVAPGEQVLQLRAVQTNTDTMACEGALSGSNIPVELAFECNKPTTCKTNNGVVISAAQTLAIEGNPNGSVVSYQPVNMNFDASGVTNFSFNYLDAGEIRLHARKEVTASAPDPAFILNGASNQFVVKPAGLCVEATEAASVCVSGNASCSKFKKAGENFDLNVRGVTWESAADTNFCSGVGGTNATTKNFQLASIGLAPSLVAPSGGANATLGVTTVTIDAASNGSKTLTNQTISEVGVFTISANPPQYLNENLGLFTSANIGRFIPDRFELSAGIVTEACASGGFTYLSQDFTTSYTLTAKNTGTATTVNYRGGFIKLDATLGALDYGAIDLVIPTLFPTRLTETGLATFNWHDDGTGDVSSTLNLARDTMVDGPYLAQIGALPTDDDGVTVILASRDLDVDNDATNDHVKLGETVQRYGRMVVNNAYGPELLDLDVTLQSEYFDGAQFKLNTEDSCSSYIKTDATLSNYTGDLAGVAPVNVIEPSVLTAMINGRSPRMSPLLLEKPGAGNDGSVTVTLTVPNWLQFDFNGDLTPENPSGLATFGHYRGHDRVIYWREKFQ